MMCAALANEKSPRRDRCAFLLKEGFRKDKFTDGNNCGWACGVEPGSSYSIGPGFTLGLRQSCGNVRGLPNTEPIT